MSYLIEIGQCPTATSKSHSLPSCHRMPQIASRSSVAQQAGGMATSDGKIARHPEARDTPTSRSWKISSLKSCGVWLALASILYFIKLYYIILFHIILYSIILYYINYITLYYIIYIILYYIILYYIKSYIYYIILYISYYIYIILYIILYTYNIIYI